MARLPTPLQYRYYQPTKALHSNNWTRRLWLAVLIAAIVIIVVTIFAYQSVVIHNTQRVQMSVSFDSKAAIKVG